MLKSSAASTGLPPEEKLALMEALDHMYVKRKYQEIGSCMTCKKICIRKCSVCGTHYCCIDCENSDSPKLNAICAKFRKKRYESGSNSSLFQNRRHSDDFNSSIVKSNEKSFRLKNLMSDSYESACTALPNQMNKKSANSHSESKNRNESENSKQRFSRHNRSTTEKSSSGTQNESPSSDNYKRNAFPFRRFYNDKMSAKEKSEELKVDETKKCNEQLKPIENVITALRKSNLSSDTKKEVICTYRESADKYWVIDVNNLTRYKDIQTLLAKNCDRYESIEPKLGLICGCTYAGEWYRGKIVSVTPTVSVHFMDYGNTSDYNFNFVKRLPYDIKMFHPLAFLIQFEEGTPSQYKSENLESTKLVIRETRKTQNSAYANGTIRHVQIIEGKYGNVDQVVESSGKPKAKKLTMKQSLATKVLVSNRKPRKRSSMDSLTESSKGMIFFYPGDGKVRYGTLAPENNGDANCSIEQILNLSSHNLSPIEAEEGDYVLVCDSDGCDQRGKILSKLGSTYYVQLIDIGILLSTDRVYPLPPATKELMEFGVKVTVEGRMPHQSLVDVDAVMFQVTGSQKSGQWPCALLSTTEQDLIAKVLIERPSELPDGEPNFVSFKSGCSVEICTVCSSNSFYVRRLDEEMEQKLLEMTTKLIQFGAKAESFKSPPKVGELCCAQFTADKCFYRARVNSVKNEKVSLLFVDFGNTQEMDLKDLKSLPLSLKIVPFFAVKVTLSRVSTKPLIHSLETYLRKLAKERVELIMTFKESLSDGVVLKEKATGVVVNEVVESAKDEMTHAANSEEPNFSSGPTNGTDVLLDDVLEYTSVSPGTTCDLVLLHINENEFEATLSFWGSDTENENFVYVNSELNSQIVAYCRSSSTPYSPRDRELCLAEFEDGWYRALTVENEGDDNFYIFFLDFGNTCRVTSKSIRKIRPEFVKAPVLAMNCSIVDNERLNGRPELRRKVFEALQQLVNKCLTGVEVSKFENDTLFLVIPEIEDILTEL